MILSLQSLKVLPYYKIIPDGDETKLEKTELPKVSSDFNQYV